VSAVLTAPVAPAPARARRERDGYLDALRAGSLLVVVLWHLLATKLTWTATGPHATNPLGSVPGLWLGTWVLQVMPVFFYLGGYLHRRSWRPGYLRYRLVGLFAMAAPLLVAWVIVGGVLALAAGNAFADGTVKLALSPLWFLAVYVMLVATLPLWLRLHDRLGLAALPLLAGAAAAVDVLRFGLGIGWLGWVNLVLVWGLAHQAGFHHDALMRAPRRVGYALIGGGITVLCGLLALGYPGAMVGVPG
jgi:acyltransferase-like protein